MDDIINLLKDVTYKNTPKFNLNGYETYAKPVKVYDGDTVHFAFYYKDNVYIFKTRFEGIDTAEIRSKNQREKEYAKKTKEYLEKLMGGLVYLKCGKCDKYGRLLVTLFKDKNDQPSINQLLLDEGYAYEYDGKTKKRLFEEWFPLRGVSLKGCI